MYYIKKILSQKKIVIEPQFVSEDKMLIGRKALIVGGGTGIGRAIARKLYEAGAEIIIASRSLHENEDFCVHEIWDVEDAEAIEFKFTEIVKKYGQIDIVVNSQGVCPEKDFSKKIDEINIEDYDKVMDINLRSVYFICLVACKYFKKENIHGHILNIASTEGLKGAVVPYGLSKAGVVSLTKGLGKREIENGIVINGIAPGATATSMMRRKDIAVLNANHIPSGRYSTPDEIANVALLLVSDMGNNMCGTIITVDGGESLH